MQYQVNLVYIYFLVFIIVQLSNNIMSIFNGLILQLVQGEDKYYWS
jgi:hypothetical protein